MFGRISVVAAMAVLLCFTSTADAGRRCIPCGGCTDPCSGGGCGVQTYAAPIQYAQPQCVAPQVQYVAPSPVMAVAPTAPARQLISGPVTIAKVVMVPTYVTETRAQPTTEYRDETRYRTKTVYNTVPVTETRYRTRTVMVPKTESKTVEYTEMVPHTEQKTVSHTHRVPVWNEVPETYTVRVPRLVDRPEQYTVQVADMVDEEFTYTVRVPHAVTETKMKTVSNAVPVVRSRTVNIQVPVTRTQSVSKDYGHWETRVDEVASAPACAPATSTASYSNNVSYTAGGCGSYGGCGSTGYGVSQGCGSCCGCGSSQASSGLWMRKQRRRKRNRLWQWRLWSIASCRDTGSTASNGHPSSMGPECASRRSAGCRDAITAAQRDLHRIRATPGADSRRVHVLGLPTRASHRRSPGG